MVCAEGPTTSPADESGPPEYSWRRRGGIFHLHALFFVPKAGIQTGCTFRPGSVDGGPRVSFDSKGGRRSLPPCSILHLPSGDMAEPGGGIQRDEVVISSSNQNPTQSQSRDIRLKMLAHPDRLLEIQRRFVPRSSSISIPSTAPAISTANGAVRPRADQADRRSSCPKRP